MTQPKPTFFDNDTKIEELAIKFREVLGEDYTACEVHEHPGRHANVVGVEVDGKINLKHTIKVRIKKK
jgi:hypothetical protein